MCLGAVNDDLLPSGRDESRLPSVRSAENAANRKARALCLDNKEIASFQRLDFNPNEGSPRRPIVWNVEACQFK
jgi:hypothetical protein